MSDSINNTVTECQIYSPKSIADVVMEQDVSRFRKWLLRKLMPEGLWELPPQRLMTLQKGAVIGNITVTTTGTL